MRGSKGFLVLFSKKGLLAFCLLSFPAHAANVALTVAQTGADSGIRNRLFTTWLPAGQSFAGLDGRITLAGNAPGFSEALVLLGTTPDGPAACARRNATTIPGMPAVSRLWAGILKSNDATPVSIPVSVSLAHPVPPVTGAGTCLVTLVSAGYVFLRRDAALYTTTRVDLDVATATGAAEPVQAFGMGGEFRFAPGTANYVGIQANRPLAVEAIAASVSAAPVAGAPADARWGRMPSGGWRVATAFLYLPAPACAAAHMATHQPGPDYSVLRLADPVALRRPGGATDLLDVPLAGHDTRAAQETRFRAVTGLAMKAGDCLFAFTSAAPDGDGLLDVENQSTVYLRALPRRP